jgi:hypothetical protein
MGIDRIKGRDAASGKRSALACQERPSNRTDAHSPDRHTVKWPQWSDTFRGSEALAVICKEQPGSANSLAVIVARQWSRNQDLCGDGAGAGCFLPPLTAISANGVQCWTIIETEAGRHATGDVARRWPKFECRGEVEPIGDLAISTGKR